MADAVVDSVALQRFVVRVTVDGTLRGTGFFVAPGWILTCAHVVKTADRLQVTPAGGAPVDGEVRARSLPRPANSPTALWPFPDLALVEVPAEVDGGCVLLETSLPGAAECLAWGYARREEGVDPVGSPVSLRFAGVAGDGFLTLKADMVRPGLSGAPLVCPQRRAVVGVMTASRNRNDTHGGWSAPIAALTGAIGGAPDELVAVGRDVVRANRAAVVADRRSWHEVVPIPDADAAVRQSWGTFRKTRRADPADLLLADFRVVPYLFREPELDGVERWCLDDAAVAIAMLPGVGGSGKTRFAVELCVRMRDRHGWVAGEVRDLVVDREPLARLPVPRLLVVDYAEGESPAVLRELLDRLRAGASDIAPVRVVLLTRERGGAVDVAAATVGSIRSEATAAVRQLLDDREETRHVTAGLTAAERTSLYDAAAAAFVEKWETSAPDGRPPLDGAQYAVALPILFEAFDAVLGQGGSAALGSPPPDDPFWGPSPAQRVLAHEERYWRIDAPDEHRELLRRCVAVATLAGAADRQAGDALLRALPELAGDDAAERRTSFVHWLASLYRGTLALNPLRPDRLGEALVTAGLLDHDDAENVLAKVFLTGDASQLVRAVTVLARCAAQDDTARTRVIQALADQHPVLTLRAEAIAVGTPDRPGRADVANALVDIWSGPLGHALAERESDNTGYQRDVSVSLERLGNLARAVGDGGRARELYQRGLTIREQLAEREPDNTGYQRDVSVSLNKLGDLARAVGDGGRARELYQRGLTIREQLAEREPDNTVYQRDVSVSLERLGDLARAVGDGGRARELYERGLTIREQLAEREPDNTGYQRDVSVSLDRLGDLAVAVGDGGRARELYQRGLTIREQLAEREPDNTGYQRDVSVSLNKLGDLARAVGDGGRARELYQRGLTIREQLAEREPDNTVYQRDVSVSLDRLGDLARAVGDGGRARELYERGLTIAEQLAEREPDNTGYQRDVSVSLNKLGDLAVAVGDGGRARELYERGLTIAEQLAEREPDNTGYQRDVSVSLNKLGDLAVAVGDGGRARELYERGLTIREQLAEREPDNTGYQRDVSVSLNKLGDLAVAVGDGGRARELYERGLTIAEQLAEREPDNTGYQRDVSFSLNKLGDLAVAVGDGGRARELYERGLTIAEQLAEREPDNTGYQRDVSVSLDRLGDLARAVGDGGRARELYERGLTIAEQLAEREPDNTVYQRDVSFSLERLGAIAMGASGFDAAAEHLSDAVEGRRRLFRAEPYRLDLAEELAVSLYQLAQVVDDDAAAAIRRDARRVLDAFVDGNRLTEKGRAVLAWVESSG